MFTPDDFPIFARQEGAERIFFPEACHGPAPESEHRPLRILGASFNIVDCLKEPCWREKKSHRQSGACNGEQLGNPWA